MTPPELPQVTPGGFETIVPGVLCARGASKGRTAVDGTV